MCVGVACRYKISKRIIPHLIARWRYRRRILVVYCYIRINFSEWLFRSQRRYSDGPDLRTRQRHRHHRHWDHTHVALWHLPVRWQVRSGKQVNHNQICIQAVALHSVFDTSLSIALNCGIVKGKQMMQYLDFKTPVNTISLW